MFAVPVPVTVTVLVPAGVEIAAVIVNVELPPLLTEAGLKEALAPVGRPEALRVTLCAEPLVIAVEIVDVPLFPWVTLMLVGLAEIEKSFTTGAVTVKDIVVE